MSARAKKRGQRGREGEEKGDGKEGKGKVERREGGGESSNQPFNSNFAWREFKSTI